MIDGCTRYTDMNLKQAAISSITRDELPFSPRHYPGPDGQTTARRPGTDGSADLPSFVDGPRRVPFRPRGSLGQDPRGKRDRKKGFNRPWVWREFPRSVFSSNMFATTLH